MQLLACSILLLVDLTPRLLFKNVLKRSLLAYSEWCKLFLRAASAADRMQGSLRRASTDDMSDLECMDTPSGT